MAPQRRPTFVELSQHLSKMFSDEKVGLIQKFPFASVDVVLSKTILIGQKSVLNCDH